MAASWSHVKFESCGTVCNVPTSYFKSVIEKSLQPKDLIVNAIYSVFWSADNETTPQDIIGKGNEIVDMDNLSVKEKNRLLKANKNKPLVGYYDACLLDLRSCEDSFQTVSTSTTTSSKRLVIPTEKALVALKAGEVNKSKPAAASKNKATTSKAARLAAEEASRSNILSLLSKASDSESLKVSNDSHDISTKKQQGSDENDVNSADYWKRKFEEAQSEINQKKLVHLKKTNKGQSAVLPLTIQSLPKPRKSSKKESTDSIIEELENKPNSSSKEDSSSDDEENSSGGDANVLGDAKPDEIKPNESEVSEETSDDEREMAITFLKKKKIKKGAEGDSLFVFNEATKLWTPKVLAIRSPTGLSALGPQKVGYPKLTPQKKKAVSAALKRRIKDEPPAVSKKERMKRRSRLNYFLSQKISSVRRSLRLKGIQIPSAEAVNQLKEQDQAADGTGAYQDE